MQLSRTLCLLNSLYRIKLEHGKGEPKKDLMTDLQPLIFTSLN